MDNTTEVFLVIILIIVLVLAVVVYNKSKKVKAEYHLGYFSSYIIVMGAASTVGIIPMLILVGTGRQTLSNLLSYLIMAVVGAITFLLVYKGVPEDHRSLKKLIPAILVVGIGACVHVCRFIWKPFLKITSFFALGRSIDLGETPTQSDSSGRSFASRYSDGQETWVFSRESRSDGSGAYLINELDRSREIEVLKSINHSVDGIVYDPVNHKTFYPCS